MNPEDALENISPLTRGIIYRSYLCPFCSHTHYKREGCADVEMRQVAILGQQMQLDAEMLRFNNQQVFGMVTVHKKQQNLLFRIDYSVSREGFYAVILPLTVKNYNRTMRDLRNDNFVGIENLLKDGVELAGSFIQSPVESIEGLQRCAQRVVTYYDLIQDQPLEGYKKGDKLSESIAAMFEYTIPEEGEVPPPPAEISGTAEDARPMTKDEFERLFGSSF